MQEHFIVDAATITRLNAINRDFYAATAAAFDATRSAPWPGWLRLLPHLELDAPLHVLDVGCGNGRFGVFLAQRAAAPLYYHGLDNSPALLDRARENLAAFPHAVVTLDHRDIISHPPDSGAYDLVVLFGVMHHVPGESTRRDLVRVLAARLKPGGLLAFACWRFYEYARFRARITPWPADLAPRVERGDYLLDWRQGERALRYCHYVDDAEHAALTAASGLTGADSYRADGRDGSTNRYSILRR